MLLFSCEILALVIYASFLLWNIQYYLYLSAEVVNRICGSVYLPYSKSHLIVSGSGPINNGNVSNADNFMVVYLLPIEVWSYVGMLNHWTSIFCFVCMRVCVCVCLCLYVVNCVIVVVAVWLPGPLLNPDYSHIEVMAVDHYTKFFNICFDWSCSIFPQQKVSWQYSTWSDVEGVDLSLSHIHTHDMSMWWCKTSVENLVNIISVGCFIWLYVLHVVCPRGSFVMYCAVFLYYFI